MVFAMLGEMLIINAPLPIFFHCGRLSRPVPEPAQREVFELLGIMKVTHLALEDHKLYPSLNISQASDVINSL